MLVDPLWNASKFIDRIFQLFEMEKIVSKEPYLFNQPQLNLNSYDELQFTRTLNVNMSLWVNPEVVLPGL